MSQGENKPSLLEYAVKELKNENNQLKDEIDSLSKNEIKKREDLLNLQSAALEAAANGIVITDTEGNVNWVNNAFTKLTGYTKDEANENNLNIFKSGLNSEKFYEDLWNRISAGEIWNGETKNSKKDGTLYTEEMTITPVKNSNGEITNYIAIKHDITKRKENERNLIINQHSVDQSSLGVLWINTKSELIYANKTAYNNLGYTRKEILNLNVSDIDPFWPDQDYFDSQINLLRNNSGLKFESINKRKDGSVFPVSVSLKLIEYENEEIIVAYIEDISISKSIREIEQLLISTNSLDELLTGMHTSIKKVFDAPNCYLALQDQATNLVSFPYFEDENNYKPGPREPRKGLTEHLIKTGKSLKLDREDYLKLVENGTIEQIGPAPHSWIGIPLFIKSKSSGALVFQSYEETITYGEQNLKWLNSIASLVTAVIEKKLAENKIQENEEKFKAIINSAKDAISTIDEDYNVIFWNEAAHKLFGYSEAEALGKNIHSLIIPERYKKSAEERFNKVTSIGKDFKGTFEITACNKDGHEIDAELSVSLTEISKNWHTITIWRDITNKQYDESCTEKEKEKIIKSLKNELIHVNSNYSILDSIFEELPHHIYIKDQHSRFTKVNKSMVKFMGFESEEELLGKTDSDFFDSAHAKEFLEEEINIMKSGKPLIGKEHKEVKKNGDISWARTSKFPLYNSENKEIGTFGITIDITNRKKAESELRDSHYKIRQLIENSTLGIIRIDEDGEIIMANPAMIKMLSYESQNDLINNDMKNIYSNINNRAKFLQIMKRDEKISGFEDTLLRMDGSEIDVRKSAWAVKDKNKKIIYYEVIVEDITEQNQILKILHESEFKYRMLIDKLNEAVFLMIGKQFEVVNSKFREILEINEEELFSEDFNLMNFVSPESKQKLLKREAKISAGKDVDKILQLIIITKNGNEKEVELSLSNLNFNGRTATQGVVRDLTEVRKQETQIRHLQKMEAIGTLAAGIAHEINTPSQFVNDNLSFLKDSYKDIEPILKFAKQLDHNIDNSEVLEELIKKADLDYLQKEIPIAIDQSIDGVERISQIVGAMRDFAHTGPKDKISADLHRIINNSITLSKNAWKYIAKIEKNYAKSSPTLVCQPNDLNQVIVNMIVNSSHAMETKFENSENVEGKIKITTLHESDYIEIIIEDNGCGMPENVKKRIFDPFYTTKDVGKGTGQGLAIAYDIIVTKHNGNITVESEENVGTIIKIRMPKDQPTQID